MACPHRVAKLFALLLLLLLLLVSVSADGRRRSSRRRYVRNHRQPWWGKRAREQGPNVCAVERVQGTARRFIRPWTGGSLCGSPTVIRFECCEGFAMLNSEPGCSLVKPLENLIESAKSSGATALAHGMKVSGLGKAMSSEGPYTLFAPVNQAFLNASEELIYMLSRKTALQGQPPSLLMYHLIPSRVSLKNFNEDELLATLYYRQSLRINRFPNGMTTVNCIPLVRADIEATNGIVHTVEDILKPPEQISVMDHIVRDAQLGRFAAALVKVKMTAFLREKGPFTLFAPTDEAFDSHPREDFESILTDNDALTALLKFHVVEGVWCSSAIASKYRLNSLEGSPLTLTCNGTTKHVNEALFLQTDIMATNGVIHVINEILVPDSAKSLRQVAQELDLETFLKLLPLVGLENMLMNNGRFTVFAPTDEAFASLKNETMEDLMDNPAALQDILMGHLVTGKYTSSNLIDKQALPTLHMMRRLRVKLYRKRTMIENALLLKTDKEARNGVIHVIDDLIFPPQNTIGQYIKKASNFTTLSRYLNITTTNLLEALDTGRGPFTLFAPDNYAFTLLPPGHMARLLEDSKLLTKVLNDHILDDIIFTKGLLPKSSYQMRTRNGRHLSIREDDGSWTVGIATIKRPDIVCRNGVIHRVNRLIQLN